LELGLQSLLYAAGVGAVVWRLSDAGQCNAALRHLRFLSVRH
jgi:hypothetical protein